MTDLRGHFSSIDACCAHFNIFILSIEITYLCVSIENVATAVYISFALQYSIQSTRSILVT